MKATFKPCWLLSLALSVIAASVVGAADLLEIDIDRGGVVLKGKFYAAEGTGALPAVILLHGFPGNETDVMGLGRKLSEAGIHALAFNYSGTHRSQGEMSFEHAQRDIRAAFDFIRRPENVEKFGIDTARIILGGWCFGGNMALAYAAGHVEVAAVFSIAGNDHGEFFREYARNPEFQKMVDDGFAAMTAPPTNVRFARGALPKEIVASGLDKLDPIFDLRASAPRLAPKDILLIAGWNDRQVTVEQYILPFYRALEQAKAGKVRIMAFQDDHYFKNSREELARAVIDWLRTVWDKKPE